MEEIVRIIKRAEIIFWDFDGVIKDSVSIKSEAFAELFRPFGTDFCNKVRNHHNRNGGVSRFIKIPIYLDWAGLEINDEVINNYCAKLRVLVEKKVIASDWVLGVKSLIYRSCAENKINVIVSATPQDEIEKILSNLKIRKYFQNVFGSPMTKVRAIRMELEKHSIKPSLALMLGDAPSDYEAALKNEITFILRRTKENQVSMPNYKGYFVENFQAYV